MKQKLLLLAICVFFTFAAGAQTTHMITKTAGSSITIPSFVAGDTFRITGDTLQTDDWNTLRGVNKLYHLEIMVANQLIPGDALKECPGLKSITCPFVTLIKGWVFYKCPLLTSVSFPRVTIIEYGALQQTPNLNSLDLPSLTNIGGAVFYHCNALTSVNFPFVTYLGPNGFEGCNALTSVNFPALTSIEVKAFYNCPSLTSVSFPSVTNIGNNAFYGCSALNLMQLESTPPQIGTSAFSSVGSLLLLVPDASAYNSSIMTKFPAGSKAVSAVPDNGIRLLAPGENLILNSNLPPSNFGNFQWKKDGVSIPNGTTASYIKNGVTVADGGLYALSFTYDLNGDHSITPNEKFSIAAIRVAVGSNPTISGNSSGNAALNHPFSETFTIGGVLAPVVQLLSPLPKGMSFDASTGKLSGTPTELGNFSLHLLATNNFSNYSGEYSTFDYTLSVHYTSDAYPYLIYTVQDLLALADSVAAGKTNGRYFKLMTNINLANTPWTPIGSEHTPFQGNFNGNGHSIYGLAIKQDVGAAGLFNWMASPSVVRNLQVEASIDIAQNWWAGIIAAANGNWTRSGGTIQNCVAIGTVKGGMELGGLVGVNAGEIKNCYAQVGIEAGININNGGLAGRNYGTIHNCYFSGTLNQNTGNCGAITGQNYPLGDVSDCYFNNDLCDAAGIGNDIENSEDATGVTAAEMQKAVTFSGWNFDTDWTILEEKSIPYFSWQSAPAVDIVSSASVVNFTLQNPGRTYSVNVFNKKTGITTTFYPPFTGNFAYASGSSDSLFFTVFETDKPASYPVLKTGYSYFTIHALVDNSSHGNIVPGGDQTVIYDANQKFTFTPNTGYVVGSLLVDDVNIPDSIAGGSYTFKKVTKNHTIQVVFRQNSAIEGIQTSKNALKAYPNPVTNGELTIEISSLIPAKAKAMLIEIYDINGKSAGSYNLSKMEAEGTTIDISHLPKGVYFVKVGNESVKIVKN